ncbi:MAG: TIGR03032 family protein, partial [Bacteroidota bacterium]
TPDFPDLLDRLDCSVALSTYQAGKVIFIGGQSGEQGGRLVQLPRTFRKPMGMTIQGDRMAVATKEEVVVLGSSRALAPGYPAKPRTYDTLFVPTQVLLTGECDLHDLAFIGPPGGDRTELTAVNTRFSCLCRFDARYHFQPVWTPPFITDLVDEDRCHLNGMAISEDGSRPVYVTALGATNVERGWRESRLTGGVVMDVASGEIVVAGLAMPHSPRLIDGKLFALVSAEGLLVEVNVQAGTVEPIIRLPGFVRGLARHGDYLFIGMSKLRPGRSLGDLPLAQQDLQAGVAVVHRTSGLLVGQLTYETSCEEIYDVAVLPGLRRPGILGMESPLRASALATPQYGFWGRPQETEEASTPSN